MLLVKNFLLSIITDMLANVTWLKSNDTGDSNLAMMLIAAPFTPGTALLLADITPPPASFFDWEYILLGSDDQLQVVNSAGQQGIRLTEPAGGFTWQVSDDSLGPVVVCGVALVRIDLTPEPDLLLATATIPPVTLGLNGETLQLSSILGFMNLATFESTTSAIGGTPAILDV